MDKISLVKNIILYGSIAGAIFTIILYMIYFDAIIATTKLIPDSWIIILIISIRMVLLAGMSFYMFRRWLSQESQYFSDIPFLFAFFFLMVMFGKAFDLLYNLTYYTTNEATFLFLIKIRFIIAIMSLAPLYYLSIWMILFYISLDGKYERLISENYRNKLTYRLMSLILTIEFIIIMLYLNVKTTAIILPAIVLPSLVIIFLIFYFSYRNKRLTQVNTLLLTIGFGAYLASQILRPLLHIIFSESVMYSFSAELVDLIIFGIIFIGLIQKHLAALIKEKKLKNREKELIISQ
ncbi:MAG: hypothetical protein ACTSVV_01425 [Promethearchaeota archaeon]